MKLNQWQDLIVCSYFTPGPYKKEADRLIASLEKLELPYHVIRCAFLKDRGWKAAVRYKPFAIGRFMSRNPNRPILFVDADSVIVRDPRLTLPNTWTGKDVPPISVHSFKGQRCSGTVVCAPTDGARKILVEWANCDAARPDLPRPQQALEFIDAINSQLDPEWCWIFDLSPVVYGKREPIVKHLQASREYREDRPTSQRLLESRRLYLKEYALR